MSWKIRDGQNGLRSKIARELEKDGVFPNRAQEMATNELLKLRGKKPGKYVIYAGNTAIEVTVNEN